MDENRNQPIKSLQENILLFREKHIQKFIFIHINKNAGTSIEKTVGLYFKENKHKTALEKIQKIGLNRWKKKFTFTIVRNPWDRTVSLYSYRVKTNQTALKSNPVDFKDWVKLTYLHKDPFYFDSPKMFMPQLDWITNKDGDILVDFIGRFEKLNEDFDVICHHLGRNLKLPHVNSSSQKDYKIYYDDETINIISSFFKKDIDCFDYKF